jgi:tetratricopeptide (TPR) repeat protein
LDAFLPVVQKYPCGYGLIINLGSEYRRLGCYEKSIPLYLSAIQSGYLKGTGRFDWEWKNLAWDFSDLGYPDESIYCGTMAFSDCSKRNLPYVYWKLGMSYKERNHYAGAVQMFQYWESLKKDHRGELFAFLSVCQDGDLFSLKDPNESFTSISEHPFRRARNQLANGLYDEAEKTMKEIKLGSISREDLLEAYMIFADIYLLSGKFDAARISAVYAWSVSPRSRQVAYLLTQALRNDRIALARYVKVALFICKEDPYWKSVSVGLRDVSDESEEAVMELYHNIKNKLDTTSNGDDLKFWQKYDPFEIEYICMTLLEQSEKPNYDEILKFYLRYRATMSGLSKWQKAHTRIFFLQLLQLIPAEDRQGWMSSLK